MLVIGIEAYNMEYKLAVLLTCHNRINKTCACLNSLKNVQMRHKVDIFITDDGSTDGTSDMINKEFPNVLLVKGDGNLFWSRGMFLAWKEALKGGYDYYLWLNDDVVLYPNFLDELFDTLQKVGGEAIVSGLIENKDKTEILYGGFDKQKRIVHPSDKPSPITFMNGNVVLIPEVIVDSIGIIDPVYHHDLGDVDYGLRAIEAGFKVVTTCVPVAYGYKNNYCRVRKWNSTLIERFKRLYSPMGSNPSINFYFRRKHFGILNAVNYWSYLHLINILSDGLIVFLFGGRYVDEN